MKTSGIGRTLNNIININAIPIENDSGERVNKPLQPNFVIESSPGKYHEYYTVTGVTAFQQVTMQERFVKDFHSDPNATDLSRVLRLTGFYHQKKSKRKGLTGRPHLVKIIEVNRREPYEACELLTKFGHKPNLEDLIEQNQKVSRLFLGLASKLEACRKYLINPEQNQLDDKTRSQVLSGINLFELGDRHYQAGITLNPVKTALESIKAGYYSKLEVDDAVAAIDALKALVPDNRSMYVSDSVLHVNGEVNLWYLWSEDTTREVTVALNLVDSEERDTWIKMGMALKADFGEAGFAMWNQWSSSAPNYDPSTIRKDWDSFTPENISMGSIFHEAQQVLIELVAQADREGML